MQTIDIRDTATPAVKEVLDRAKSDAVKSVAGRAGANVFRAWFRNLEQSRPNALGGARTHFWGRAASATYSRPTASGADVITAQTGVQHQRYGGDIKPSGRGSAVTGKAIARLAIPARAEAHGKTPGDFPNLQLEVFRSGGKYLVGLAEPVSQEVSYTKSGKVRKGKLRGGAILFWLVRSAHKDPDAGVYPPDGLVRDGVQLATLDYVMRNRRAAA